MKAASSSSVRYLLLPQKTSTPVYQTVIDQRAEKAYLIQKIELLQMENQQLKRRDQNNKKINLALTQAISKSQYQPEDIKMLLAGLFQNRVKQQKVKQQNQQYTQTQTVHSVQFTGLKYSRQQEQNPECYNKFQHTIRDSLKNSYANQQDNQRNYFDYTDNFQYRFSKTRSPHTNLNISAFVNQNYGTPIRDKGMTPKKKTFQRTQSYLEGPATHRSSVKSARGRNVATDLLCDICGLSFSPMVFLSHVQQCDGDHNNSSSEDLRKITDADFSEEEEEERDGSEELVQLLESRKKKLSAQIEKLKKMRGSPERKKRLETDLDQIVFIIKNKKTLNNSDIKRLLKQKNYYEKCFR